MCGIAGFYHSKLDFTNKRELYENILNDMNIIQHHRGPDESDTFLTEHTGLAHTRLSIIDLLTGSQPMIRRVGDVSFCIVYNGELYNMDEIRDELITYGWSFESRSDTELILCAYIEFGADFVKKLNGIFAFAIYDGSNNTILLYRDRSGVKPLFYTVKDEMLVFSSELKGLFKFPGVKPAVGREGLNEIFSIGPARTYGKGVFENVYEVLPGYYMKYSEQGLSKHCYWKLESHEHEDDYDTTVRKVSELIYDSVSRQMVSDVPIGTFLSGGVDSSLVSAICAKRLKEKGKRLQTFSFDFTDNDVYFKPSSFQPSQDRPYVDEMVKALDTQHTYLDCDVNSQADCLVDSVLAHDLPAMADVDSSMLYFCRKVKPYVKVVLTGECADEIFGGYPWFHKKECFEAHTFPWTMDLTARKALLRDDFLDFLKMDDYILETYEKSVSETPRLEGEDAVEARRREISFLNQKWFMQTLLNRMDRASMYSGLEARVPFADHRLIEYVFNVPWEMKTPGGQVKGLLRDSAKGLLPESIRTRRKSPYPKTYDKKYEQLVKTRLLDIVKDSEAPILQFIDTKKLDMFLASPSDYGKPWYGQLMAGPQLLAYMLQVNTWLVHYNISIQ